jgi:uncharacterized protein
LAKSLLRNRAQISLMWRTGLVLLTLIAPTSKAVAELFSDGQNALLAEDYGKAARLFRSAAEKGDPRAQYNLGILYIKGDGVAQDFVEAASWFRRAADQGFSRAQFALGDIYAKGLGVKRDMVVAYKWQTIAAAVGIPQAVHRKAEIRKMMTPSELAAGEKLASQWKPKPETSDSR